LSDLPPLVRFYLGFNEIGIGKDGLPMFEDVVKIKKSKPPLLEVDYVAVESDFEEYPAAYKLFQNEMKGRRVEGLQGYPLALWTVPSPSELKECFQHDIFTVEQLARISNSTKHPAPIVELAKRAKKMVELSQKQGKYEQIIHGLEAQLVALNEINAELRTLNEGMKTKLDILTARGIAA
jgi:hypothetical protein